MLERIAAGRTDLVIDWLEEARSPDTAVQGASLLSWCAYYGDVAALRLLLKAGAGLDGLGSNFGLGAAAFHRHWQLCQFLLEQGADPNFADPVNGETALHSTLCRRDKNGSAEQVVRVLLAWKADPTRPTKPGAATDGFMRDARTRGEAPLHRAAAYGSPATIERLIAAGAKVDQRDAAGDSPLSWASWALRDTQILRLLVLPGFEVRPDRKSMDAYLVGEPVNM